MNQQTVVPQQNDLYERSLTSSKFKDYDNAIALLKQLLQAEPEIRSLLRATLESP